MTSVDVELAAAENCKICLLVFDCATSILCGSLLILGDRTEHLLQGTHQNKYGSHGKQPSHSVLNLVLYFAAPLLLPFPFVFGT